MPSISDLLDSDMEGNNYMDENSILSSVSDTMETSKSQKPTEIAKKPRKRRCVTMPKTKSKAAKSSPDAAPRKRSAKVTTVKHKALENLMVDDYAQDDAELDHPEELVETEGKAKVKGKPAAKKAAKGSKATASDALDEGEEVEEATAVARSNYAQSKTAKAPKVIRAEKSTAKRKLQKDDSAGSLPEPAEADDNEQEADELDVQVPPPKRARTESRTRQEPAGRRRAGSASDTERGDPNLRRKLGDITRKFENIDMKYKNLKEVGISEANANVERLRKQCEAATEASNNLISSLKQELAQQSSLAQEARKMKKDLHAREEEISRLRATQIETASSLGAAQNEIKALQAKLTAARTASVEPPAAKPPGSAVKSSRSVAAGVAEAAHAAHIAQMKLDLYGDLTGLIVRSVKRAEDGDTYDCIQTGRNGSKFSHD